MVATSDSDVSEIGAADPYAMSASNCFSAPATEIHEYSIYALGIPSAYFVTVFTPIMTVPRVGLAAARRVSCFCTADADGEAFALVHR